MTEFMKAGGQISARTAAAVALPPLWASALVVLVLAAGGAWVAWRRRSHALAVCLAGFALLPAVTLVQLLTWWTVVPAVAALVGVRLFWSRSESVVTRWGDRSRRKSGVASVVDIWRKASPRAMRRQARRVRPSLAEVSWWELYRTPVTEYAVMLCRVGWQQVWASSQVVVLVFGSPRKGKSAMLAGTVLNAPGAALVASTKLDLLRATRELRSRRGPVRVFNPGGEGGDEAVSTVAFDVLTGCTDPVVAAFRAEDMIAAGGDVTGGGGDRDYWDGQARRVLSALMHAAAIGGRSMIDVQAWVADPEAAKAELTKLLRSSPVPAMVADARQFLTTNERTRTSITSSIMPALAWLTHPAAVASANAHRQSGLPTLDVAELLAERGTIYLLGGEEGPTAPLVCALTGYVAREARRLAALAPGERLDPHLTLLLDEAAQICPVPLDRWSADMGGRGISIVAGFQSRAQMLARYGPARTAVIMNNAGGTVLFGGTADRDDLGWWTALAGQRDERVTTRDEHGRATSHSYRQVPVIAASKFRQLADHQVVVFPPGLPPAIGWGERYWLRPDVQDVTNPNAVRVRARAARRRAMAAVRAWLDVRVVRPIRAGLSAAAAAARWVGVEIGLWVRGEWADLRRSVARVGAWLRRRPEPAPAAEPVAAEPMADPVGAAVVPFSPVEWPADVPNSEPVGTGVGDWSGDNGHNGRGRWN
jgi:type IV secretory pathway TraG/TraD family ATPase VirD4